MSDFLEELKKCWGTLQVIKLKIADIFNVRESVLKSLNLANLNELRDKFEGVAFYDNFYQKISGVIAVEKVLKQNLIDWNNIAPKNYSPLIQINDRTIQVVTAQFGVFPVIQQTILYPIILVIQKEEKVLWVIGYSDYYFEKGVNKFVIDDFSIFKTFSNHSYLEIFSLK